MIDACILPMDGNHGPSAMGAIEHDERSELVVLGGTLNHQFASSGFSVMESFPGRREFLCSTMPRPKQHVT